MAQCMFPFHVERQFYTSQEERTIPVPCGKCPACLRRRLAAWSHRLEIEALRWPKQFFITLTYNTDYVPISENGFMTLRKTDVQKFFKRLRKKTGNGRFKYYSVGEYGTNNKRPHYHVILLAAEHVDTSYVTSSWIDVETGHSFGDCYFGDVAAGSIRYCVQYYDKGDWYPSHQRDDREPEFSIMSQGIGRSFLSETMVKHIINNPQKQYIYDNEGHKIALPKYYKKRLFDYVGTDSMVANHPSLLLHRDDMLERKEERAKEAKRQMEQLEQPEQTKELNEARKWEIINYRKSKRKTRK